MIARTQNDSKSGLASTYHRANLSGLILVVGPEAPLGSPGGTPQMPRAVPAEVAPAGCLVRLERTVRCAAPPCAAGCAARHATSLCFRLFDAGRLFLAQQSFFFPLSGRTGCTGGRAAGFALRGDGVSSHCSRRDLRVAAKCANKLRNQLRNRQGAEPARLLGAPYAAVSKSFNLWTV